MIRVPAAPVRRKLSRAGAREAETAGRAVPVVRWDRRIGDVLAGLVAEVVGPLLGGEGDHRQDWISLRVSFSYTVRVRWPKSITASVPPEVCATPAMSPPR